MDTMPNSQSMENESPLSGLNPADLLRQGMAEDTLTEDASRSFAPPTTEDLAPLFPQFEILELIGKGGMGAVYQVRQKDLDRIVALKILPPAIGRSPAFASRFTREAKALAKLNHPGIVTIHEFGQRDGLYFIVMEFVDGVNLAQLMKSGRVSPREALAIVPQICDALQFAHDQGIVHRDIKPENILIDRLGRVKVADFGIAKMIAPFEAHETEAVPSEATIPGMGTPQYMAPEQVEHPSEVDHRADIYALGVVFYQMLTGELPGRELQAPSRKVRIDVRLDEVVLKAMEKNPELRFQQASVMKTRVDELGTAPDLVEPTKSKSGTLKTRSTGTMIAIGCGVTGLLGLVLISLVAGAFWLFSSERETYVREMQAAKRAEAIARAETQVRQGSPKAALSAGAVFSPASEWVLERSEPLGGYDMESGRFIPFQPIPGVSGPEGAARWRQENGVDLMVDRGSQTPGILFGGFVGNRVDASMWEASAEFVAHSAPPPPRSGVFEDRMAFLPAPAGSGNPDTILIRTQGGNAGLLQILEATDTRGVKLRYKLVQTEKQAALSASIPASSRMESPKLQFLAWQDEWKADESGAVRHPNGSPVTDATELKWLQQVQPGGVDVTALKLNPEPRFLHFWFSHPLFDRTSLNEVVLLDERGVEIPLGARGNAASGSQAANESNGRTGWLTKTISPGARTNLPTRATVRLRYTVGPLERTQEVKVGPNSHVSMSLEGGGRLNAIGQNAWGKAFVALAMDATAMASRRFGVMAVTKDGRTLAASGGGSSGNSDGTGIRVEDYDFDVPLSDVARFIIGSRPVRTMEWKDVVLPGNDKPGRASQPVVAPATPRDGVYFTYTGYMATVLELKGGRFRYWFESDLKRPDEPEYPLSGLYRVNTDTISLQNEQCGQPVWTFRSMDGQLTLWRPDALAIPEQDRHWDMEMLKRYGGGSILVASDKPAEELWERRGPPSMTEGPKPAAQAWLSTIDAGEYSRSWKEAAEFFRSAVAEESWVASMKTFRKPLGNMLSRTLKSAQRTQSLPGAPDGDYVVMQFDSSFAEKKAAVETVTFTKEKDGVWRASGYFIK